MRQFYPLGRDLSELDKIIQSSYSTTGPCIVQFDMKLTLGTAVLSALMAPMLFQMSRSSAILQGSLFPLNNKKIYASYFTLSTKKNPSIRSTFCVDTTYNAGTCHLVVFCFIQAPYELQQNIGKNMNRSIFNITLLAR